MKGGYPERSGRKTSVFTKTPIRFSSSCLFFFNNTAPTKIYTLSLHDALPISGDGASVCPSSSSSRTSAGAADSIRPTARSEEHTSELESQSNLVCRLLLD